MCALEPQQHIVQRACTMNMCSVTDGGSCNNETVVFGRDLMVGFTSLVLLFGVVMLLCLFYGVYLYCCTLFHVDSVKSNAPQHRSLNADDDDLRSWV